MAQTTSTEIANMTGREAGAFIKAQASARDKLVATNLKIALIALIAHDEMVEQIQNLSDSGEKARYGVALYAAQIMADYADEIAAEGVPQVDADEQDWVNEMYGNRIAAARSAAKKLDNWAYKSKWAA